MSARSLMAWPIDRAFAETMDDQWEHIRELLSCHKAESCLEAMTSPVAGAQRLLESTTC